MLAEVAAWCASVLIGRGRRNPIGHLCVEVDRGSADAVRAQDRTQAWTIRRSGPGTLVGRWQNPPVGRSEALPVPTAAVLLWFRAERAGHRRPRRPGRRCRRPRQWRLSQRGGFTSAVSPTLGRAPRCGLARDDRRRRLPGRRTYHTANEATDGDLTANRRRKTTASTGSAPPPNARSLISRNGRS
jgi:hypothetical protein